MIAPKRGEVWLVNPGLTAKVRPCLILSVSFSDEDRALISVIPHTTSPRNSRFEVAIEARFLRPGVLDAQSIVTIPVAKLLRKLSNISSDQMAHVEKYFRLWLGL